MEKTKRGNKTYWTDEDGCQWVATRKGDDEFTQLVYDPNKNYSVTQGEHPDRIKYLTSKRKAKANMNTPVKSKVKAVTGAGTYKDMFSFEYEFEDGVVMKANHKTNEPRFKAGEDVEYTVKFQNGYGNLGSVSKPQEAYNPSQTPSSPGSEASTGDLILIQTCVKASADLHSNLSNVMPSPEHIVEYAYEVARLAKAKAKTL